MQSIVLPISRLAPRLARLSQEVLGWQAVTADRPDLAYQFWRIMERMSRERYHRPRAVETKLSRRLAERGLTFVRLSSEGDLALRFEDRRRAGRTFLKSVGFTGTFTIPDAFELLFQKAVEVGRSIGVTGTYALPPIQMDDPRILDFYRYASAQTSRLRIRGGRKVPGNPGVRYWTFDLLE